MTGNEIVGMVKAQNWPDGSYVVFGSCPMALAGIREANDIDLLVSETLYEELKRAGWKHLYKSKDDKPLTKGVFEAHKAWAFSSYQPTLQHLLATSTAAVGVRFASLAEVRKWKKSSGRPSDLKDIALIDSYMARGQE